jgi:hypothetical protein
LQELRAQPNSSPFSRRRGPVAALTGRAERRLAARQRRADAQTLMPARNHTNPGCAWAAVMALKRTRVAVVNETVTRLRNTSVPLRSYHLRRALGDAEPWRKCNPLFLFVMRKPRHLTGVKRVHAASVLWLQRIEDRDQSVTSQLTVPVAISPRNAGDQARKQGS